LPALLPSRTSTIDAAKTRLQDQHVQPTAAACLGCHDDSSAAVHAATQTSAAGDEACATCHAAGSALGIDVMHTLPGP
jgi:hypothetical protein